MAVIGGADDRWGEVPVAVVSLLPGADPVTADGLHDFLASRLAAFKHPKVVVMDARRLATRLGSGPERAREPQAPESSADRVAPSS